MPRPYGAVLPKRRVLVDYWLYRMRLDGAPCREQQEGSVHEEGGAVVAEESTGNVVRITMLIATS